MDENHFEKKSYTIRGGVTLLSFTRFASKVDYISEKKMKKAIFHSNLGGWGGIPCLGSKLRSPKKSKNMNENKHITNLLFTKKYEI